MQKNFVYVTMIILVSFVTVEKTAAQTKLFDLSDKNISVDFGPDGKYIVTGDTDGYIELWDVRNGKSIYDREVGSAVRGIAFSPDGESIATDGVNGRANAILLKTSSGTEIMHTELVDDATSIQSIAFSPNGEYVAIGDDVGHTYLWDVTLDIWTAWVHSKEYQISSVAFSPDGKYLATGDSSGNARLWEVSTWWGDVADLNVKKIPLGGTVRAVAFSPNGRYLAADEYDNQGNESVYIYDVIRDKVAQQIDQGFTTGRGITALAFSPDGRSIAVGNVDSEIMIYRIGTEVITLVTAITKETTIQANGAVEDLAWSPDSNLISDGKTVWQMRDASLAKIVFESEKIYDSGPLVGWSRGNSNGVIEAGERIELTVTLKNDGTGTARNVRGVLQTKDSSVRISDDLVKYGDIRSGGFAPLLFPPSDLSDRSFKIEVLDDATTHDVSFTLRVTSDNGGPWTIPITLSVVNSSNIQLTLPDDFISEEAFGTHSTYFTLNVQHPEITGIRASEIFYDDCTIILHIPEGTQAFMFPIQIQTRREKAVDLLSDVLISVAGHLSPGLSAAFEVIEFFEKISELLESERHDLEIELPHLSGLDRGRPNTKIEYLVLLKTQTKPLQSLKITVEQEYRIGTSSHLWTAHQKEVEWIFDPGRTAPTLHTVTLSDYPPFHLLPLEVQQHLLLYAGFGTAEEWRVPEETSLLANYPNPFNPETWVPYQLARPADVTITIYSASGQVVRKLALGHQSAGIYQNRSRAAYWDGRNAHGEPVASGVYFYTLTAGDFSATRKMLILK